MNNQVLIYKLFMDSNSEAYIYKLMMIIWKNWNLSQY